MTKRKYAQTNKYQQSVGIFSGCVQKYGGEAKKNGLGAVEKL
jgi:hypothetical protein